MKSDKRRIKIAKNGPYLVNGSLPLSDYEIIINKKGESIAWKKGKDYKTGENYALCRCGHSRNMPFCDGTHARIDFDGTEIARRGKYLEMAEKIEGPEYDLLDQKDLCAEARFCAAGKTTWHLVYEDDKSPEKETFLQQCHDCPSGRYTAASKNGELLDPVFEPSLGIVHDPACAFGGPIWVRGGVQIEAADSYEYEIRNRVTFCRCGKSRNKPFCDGSHLGFEED
jgi:CDGSH-type Zn-finger protein